MSDKLRMQIHPKDLDMWEKSINREPWTSAKKYADTIKNQERRQEIYWGEKIETLEVNGRIFTK